MPVCAGGVTSASQRSAELTQPIRDVGKLAIDTPNPTEQLARAYRRAGTLVEISHRISASQMVPLRTSWHVPPLFDQPQRRREIAPICQGARHDDPALVHHCRVGAGRTQFIPKFIHVAPAPQRSMTISQHGILLRATCQLTKGLELYDSCGPTPEAIQRESVQLADLGDAWCELGQPHREAKRFRESVVLIRTSGRVEIRASLRCGGDAKDPRERNGEVLYLARPRRQRLTDDDRVRTLADLARLEPFDTGWRARGQRGHPRLVRSWAHDRRWLASDAAHRVLNRLGTTPVTARIAAAPSAARSAGPTRGVGALGPGLLTNCTGTPARHGAPGTGCVDRRIAGRRDGATRRTSRRRSRGPASGARPHGSGTRT